MAWKALCHPNVLPLLGVTMTETQFMMASKWMENGNINEFIKVDTTLDQLGLVCLHSKPLSLLPTDRCIITVAQRCYQGVNLPA